MPLKASIFIPTSKDAFTLNRCLKSLNQQTVKEFEIILVGIKENSQTRTLLEKYNNLNINYFIQKKRGLVKAANEALKCAQGNFLIRIDDDVEVSKNWFKNILLTFNKHEGIGAVTGPTIIKSEDIKSRDSINFLLKFTKSKNLLFRFIGLIYSSYIYENKLFKVSSFLKSGAFTIGANFHDCLKIKGILEVENLEACNFACKIALLKKIGGFDEIFNKGLGEYHEADVAFKIRKEGYKILFNPKAIVHHKINNFGTTITRPDSYNRIRNFIIFYYRHIKIINIDYFLRFMTNLIFQNSYYIYKFLTSGNIDQLGSIPGTLSGLLKYGL